MIEVQNLTRNYGDFKAVNNVSFKIPKGEVIGLLGHNGAGKTTIMKMITGYLEPTGGSITVDSIDVTVDRIQVQNKIGYLPENCPVYHDMNVIEYLEYVANLRGIEKTELNDAIRSAIAKTQLEEKATSLISTLSRGYRQRVGVAQAIIHNPEILILDEPTNGLDPAQIEEMRSLIRNLSADSTVIISTHIMQEVHAVCDRVLIMAKGKLVVDSHIEDLEKSERISLTVDKTEEELKKVLGSIHGLTKFQAENKNNGLHTYSIETDNHKENLIPLISKTLIDNSCNIYSIHPEMRNLETVFREVTLKG